MRFLCVVLTSLALLPSCAPAPAPLEWRIESSDPRLLDRAAVVEARILRGGCDGPEVFALEIRPGDSMGPVPPPLDPGTWGFSAEARDVRCARFAYHCERVVLPGTSVVVNQLAPVTEMQVCSAARCESGSCPSEDADMDGSAACVAGESLGSCDCDDTDADVLPGAPDPCEDDVDQDCDGADDECDADCDGYPSGSAGSAGADCDDGAIDIHPNDRLREVSGRADGDRLARGCEVMPTPEMTVDQCTTGPSGEPVGDGRDQDCNGFVDDGPGCTDLTDRDRDGARACTAGMTSGCDPEDCDPGIAPGREEICGNDVDEDVDGRAEPCAPGDADGDGHAATATGGDDCDDTDPRTFPGAPDDCRTPESESCGTPASCTDQGGDADGDGYLARPPPGTLGDCNDADDEVRPFAFDDPCDGVDQDCDGVVDEIVRARPPATPDVADGCVRTSGGSVPFDYDATTPATEHCGGCGVATATNQDCCGGVPTAVDVPSSCGGCGYDCGPHTSCEGRGMDAGGGVFECACAPEGSGRWEDCNASLAGPSGGDGCESDLDTDEANCGTCGRRCGPQQTCVAGVCSCDAPYLDCDGMEATGCEVDGGSDVDNCDVCGNRCTFANGTAMCAAGRCELSGCAARFDDCNTNPADGCEMSLDTLMSCGSCGQTCSGVLNATEACVRAACDYTSCDAGFLDCTGGRANGCETNGRLVGNCGTCGNACTSIQNASPTCTAMGTCDYAACSGGFRDCDAARGNGCETNVRTTVTSCGSCATNCNTLVLNATGIVCTASACDYAACSGSTFASCDGNRANGCETSITSAAHCGGCGIACGAGESCNAMRDCECGTTTAPTGPACPAGQVCTGGMCVPV